MRVTESVATANTQFYKSVATKDKKETKIGSEILKTQRVFLVSS
jgi:hypothetical protein